MKKLLLAACSSDDDDNDNTVTYDETKGYLTNFASVKHGIVGLWQFDNASSYSEYGNDGIVRSGESATELIRKAKYETYKSDNNYILRSYAIGDVEGTGTYVDATITKLDKNNLYLYHSRDNKESKFKKVTE